jgi:PAS domain S-box-containing protein
MYFFRWLFDTRFMAHVFCYRQDPGLVGLHLVSDLSIGAAYVAISLTLVYLVRKAKHEIPFSWMFLAFGTFIIACGGTHLMEVWTLWTPVYWFSGMVKALTAVASLTTAFALPPLVPRSVRMMKAARVSEQRRMLIEETNAALKREVEERKRVEEEVRRLNTDLEKRVQDRTAELARANRSLADLAAIVQHSHDAIASMTLDGTVTSWNPAAEQMFGYTRQEVTGKSVRRLVPANRYQEFEEIVDRLVRGGEIPPFETMRLHKDGRELDVWFSISPLKDENGAITGASVIIRDITEKKRAETTLRETQKLESLGLIAGGVAHDFNNLLVGVMGNASMVLDAMTTNDPSREFVEAILSASESAAHLTSQLLAYAGKGRFVIREIDLSGVVRDIGALIATSIPRHVHVELELAPDLPVLQGDPGQMQQLVMNLVLNAAEAIPKERQGTVWATTDSVYLLSDEARRSHGGERLKPGPYVRLRVRDDGTGMGRELVERIFDPFFSTKFTGRGLGLAAVQGIVRGYNGVIEVRTAMGQGSTFEVLLPANSAPEPAPTAAPERQDLQGSGTILLIDDEEVVRLTTRRTLERFGYTVLVAPDGARAVEIFHEHAAEIEAVILDMTMPMMSAEETFRRLRAPRPDLPVILSSGYDESEAMQRFQASGIAAFIQKPYAARKLASLIKRILGR